MLENAYADEEMPPDVKSLLEKALAVKRPEGYSEPVMVPEGVTEALIGVSDVANPLGDSFAVRSNLISWLSHIREGEVNEL